MILPGVFANSRPAPRIVAPSDPYFANVQILLHLEGANNDVVTTDQKGHSIVFHGSSGISTTQKKAGDTSLRLPGSSDIEVLQAGTEFNLGSADFAIECFAYMNSLNGLQTIYSTSSAGRWVCGIYDNYLFMYNGAFIILDSGTVVTTGVWHHVAFVRSSGTYAIYLDGTRLATNAGGGDPGGNGHAYIGQEPSIGQTLNGYVDEFRLTVGSARGYTGATITVPTVPLLDS